MKKTDLIGYRRRINFDNNKEINSSYSFTKIKLQKRTRTNINLVNICSLNKKI